VKYFEIGIYHPLQVVEEAKGLPQKFCGTLDNRYLPLYGHPTVAQKRWMTLVKRHIL
jgi:hypothetical protein